MAQGRKRRSGARASATEEAGARRDDRGPDSAPVVIAAEVVDDHSALLASEAEIVADDSGIDAELADGATISIAEDGGDQLDALDLGVPPALPTALPVQSSERGVVLYDPLRRYLAEIRNFKPLSAEEEHDLAVRFQDSGDREAAYRLTTAHLRLVVRIAFEFKRSWLNLLDLVQEGNLGLLLAIRKFDPYRGIRLSTYAAWWIRAYMIKFLLDNWRLVKVGTTNARRKLLFNLRKEKEKLLALGLDPQPKLLAERLDVSEQDVIEVDRSLGVADTSLETPLSGDSDLTLGDTLASPQVPIDVAVEEEQRQEILKAKLAGFEKTLPERERVVFRERLLAEEPATLEVLGQRFGMTREGLRQVEKRIVRDLKAYLSREIRDFRALDLEPPAELSPAPAANSRSSPTRKKSRRRASKA